jgi:hypothetical protein
VPIITLVTAVPVSPELAKGLEPSTLRSTYQSCGFPEIVLGLLGSVDARFKVDICSMLSEGGVTQE